MTLGLPEDMSHRSVLTLEVKVFPKGCCHHHLKAFYLTGYNSVATIKYSRKHNKDDSSNLGLLFTHILKRAQKNKRLNSKKSKNLL